MTLPPSSSNSPPHTSASANPPPTTKPFRFKRKRSSTPPPPSKHPHHRSYHRHRRHHHSHRHRSHHPTPPSAPVTPPLSPTTAFRESLFDALADDEGAAYWERVYGQPIHTYSPYTSSHENHNGETDHLERMTDEEYVTYVRGKMWERSHGYILEERKRREEERSKKRAREEEGRRWERGVEEALRRGEERRWRQRWKGRWEGYVSGWFEGFGAEDEQGGKGEKGGMRDRIPWPVPSGKWQDVGKEEIERFFHHAPRAAELEVEEVLKRERVRWHPDKMMQRMRGGGVDEGTMKLITAVFQVVDRLWVESKAKG
ncbi:hypothetical protein ACLMJK_004902 [Lecanora helva]